MSATKPPARLADMMPGVLQRLDNEHNLKAYQVWLFWDEIVGDHAARRAQPSYFRNGVLVVTVSSHSWLQELQFMKDDLRDRLNARLGVPLIKDLELISGAVEAPRPRARRQVAAENVTAETPAIDLPAIDDPELAEAFARVARARSVAMARRSGRTRRRK